MHNTIGVDIGGTKIAAGLVDDEGRILEQLRVPTPREPDVIDAAIAVAVKQLVAQAGSHADGLPVGVAAAGFVDERRQNLRFAPNIAWREYPLADKLRSLLGHPVVVENDANAAAWAEFRFGAGQDVSDMVLITVGTGIGGGIVLDGQLLRGAFGSRQTLEKAVRSWATSDPKARAAVQAIDRRRVDYVEHMLRQAGLEAGPARARAQIFYWAFLGHALSDQPLPPARQKAVLEELLKMAAR